MKTALAVGLLALALPASALEAGRGPLLKAILRRARPTPEMKAAPALPPDALIISAPDGAAAGAEALGVRLADARLVLVGEKHDEPLQHLVQAEVLKLMHARRPDVQLGLEMLDYTKQPTLDAYLCGAMSEAEFSDFWKKNWGFDFAMYRPVLEYARANGIRVKALNAPPDIVKQVAKGGLASLTPEQRALIPAAIFPVSDPRYLAYVKESLGGHGSKSGLALRLRQLGMPAGRLERMLEAMQVWNNTMGERALAALAEGPMLVIVGAGHVVYRAGILESVRARTGSSPREDGMSVLLSYPQDGEALSVAEALARLRDPQGKELELADHFWLLAK